MELVSKNGKKYIMPDRGDIIEDFKAAGITEEQAWEIILYMYQPLLGLIIDLHELEEL